MPGQCKTKNAIYQSKVTSPGLPNKFYRGQAMDFKDRYNSHKGAIQKENSPQATALSNYIWKLKQENRQYSLSWSILGRAPPYRSGSSRCPICVKEKTYIAIADPESLLNCRSEIFTKSLFVFLKSDPKQNARSLLTPVSDPAFHALSHSSLSFALHGSFFNHFLIGQNSSTANQNL